MPEQTRQRPMQKKVVQSTLGRTSASALALLRTDSTVYPENLLKPHYTPL